MRTVAALLLVGLLSGCGAERDRTLTVLAAASMKEVLEQLEKDFERREKDVDVRLVLGSSSTLAEQVKQGAPGDVLVTADRRTMDVAEKGGALHTRHEWFASNYLVVAVPREGAMVTSVGDLENPGVDYVTCVPTAPCGASAGPLLHKAGVDAAPASEEPDVKAALARVLAGEADAAVVYRTDAVAERDDIWWLELPGAKEEPNTYWAASTKRADDKALASDWIDHLTSADDLLVAAGFLINPS